MVAAVAIAAPGPLSKVWSFYERSLRRRPVLTQAVSSALLWGVGDAMAQRIETRGRGSLDARRVALTAAFGGTVIGPAGHGWYIMLEKLVRRLGLACSLKSMLLKVTLDNLLYSPAYVLAFFAYGCMAIDGLSPAAFADKMREEFVPTMLAEAMVWPPYMAAVFSRVPVKHQLLAVNVATLFDVCFLSWMRTRHDESGNEELAAAAAKELQQPELGRVRSDDLGTEPQEFLHAEASVAAPPPPLRLALDAVVGSGEQLTQQLVAAAAAGMAAAAAAVAAAVIAGLPLPSQEQLMQQSPYAEGSVEPSNAGRGAAFMAASATCSTGGGRRMRLGAAPGATAAAGKGQSVGSSGRT